MFLINITLKNPKDSDKLDAHRAWFTRHFDAGSFVLTAPYTDRENAGMILADVKSRADLDKILAEDCYYPDLADYEVRECSPKQIAENFARLAER